jgi:hypothetical protein
LALVSLPFCVRGGESKRMFHTMKEFYNELTEPTVAGRFYEALTGQKSSYG